MYCEKCGKANPENQTKCKYCGALMPQKTSCGGFGDILSYENSEPGIKEGVTVMNQAPVTAPDKTSALAPILSIVAIGVSVVAIILSIAAMLMSASGNDAVEDADDVTEATEEMDVEEEPDDEFMGLLTKEQNAAYKYFLENPAPGVESEFDKQAFALVSISDRGAMKTYAIENNVTKDIEKAKDPGEKEELAEKWAEKHTFEGTEE